MYLCIYVYMYIYMYILIYWTHPNILIYQDLSTLFLEPTVVFHINI